MADLILIMQDATSADSGAAPGQLTRLGLQNLVKKMLGRAESDTVHDPHIQAFLNMAQMEIARAYKWRCLQFTLTGETVESLATYNWPDNMRTLHSFSIIGDTYYRKLIPLIYPHDRARYPDPDTLPSEDTPVNFVDLGTTYRLIPTPNAVYDWSMRLSKWPQDLADNSSTSDLLFMDDLLVYLTCMHMSLALSLLDDFQVYRTAVYTQYPQGGGAKRGLLQQTINADKEGMPTKRIKRPFDPSRTGMPDNYLRNPRWGLDQWP